MSSVDTDSQTPYVDGGEDDKNKDCCNKVRWWPLWLLGGLLLLFLVIIIILRGLCTDVWYINLLKLNDKLCESSGIATGTGDSYYPGLRLEGNSLTINGGNTIVLPVTQGPQGDPGLNGSNGINGSGGPAGPTGATGTAGTNGSNGATGPVGPAGPPGPSDPCGNLDTFFCQDGNSFGTLAVLGTNDNNDLAVETDGTERLRVLSSNGNVGIGTSTPSTLLSIGAGAVTVDGTTSIAVAPANAGRIYYDSISNRFQCSESGGSYFQCFGSSASGWLLRGNDVVGADFIGTTNTQDFRIRTDNIQRAVMTTTGRFGIGTASPEFTLDLQGGGSNGNGGLIARGSFGSGSLTTSGAGTRMIWHPGRAAFRAGYIDGTQWDAANIGDYSVAFGRSNTASGSDSSAFGRGNTASGDYSTAFGQLNLASGNYSTAFGYDNDATGNRATAWGDGTLASAAYSTSFGLNSQATALSATAWGEDSVASDDYATAWGEDTSATNLHSTAWGQLSVASGRLATAYGFQSTASGLHSLAFGRETQALANQNTAFGFQTLADSSSNPCANQNYGAATAWGVSTQATACSATAWGEDTTATALRATAWGHSADATGQMSTAFGSGTTASGIHSLAFGFNTQAINRDNTAWGRETVAESSNLCTPDLISLDYGQATAWGVRTDALNCAATSWGWETVASGFSSTAWGDEASATGELSTAWGRLTTATGIRSTAWGETAIAFGELSTAWGRSTEANGTLSTAWGTDTLASGANSTAWGINNTASGVNSTAFGRATTASGDESVAIGQNMTVSGTESVGIGLGTGGPYTLSDNNTMAIMGGEVGIGTVTPLYSFHVSDNSDTPAAFTGTTQTCEVDTSGAGGWNCTSDERLKQNIMSMDGSLEKLLLLQGVTYNFKSNPDSDAIAGFIAQEVQKVLPGLVGESADGYLNLNKEGMIPYIVEAIKEQNGNITGINAKLSDQGYKIDNIGEELLALSKRLDNVEATQKDMQGQIKSQKEEIEKLKESLQSITGQTNTP